MDNNYIELARQFLNGNDKVFEEIVNTIKKGVYAFAFNITHDHYVADDISQETFIKIYKNRKDIQDPNALHMWVRKTELNLIRDYYRKEKGIDRIISYIKNNTERPQENLHKEKDINDEIRLAIDSLPLKYREVVIMREMEGMPHKDIADVLGVPEGTVWSRLFKAREKLRKKLEPLFKNHITNSPIPLFDKEGERGGVKKV